MTKETEYEAALKLIDDYQKKQREDSFAKYLERQKQMRLAFYKVPSHPMVNTWVDEAILEDRRRHIGLGMKSEQAVAYQLEILKRALTTVCAAYGVDPEVMFSFLERTTP
jgi:hypothetical protein